MSNTSTILASIYPQTKTVFCSELTKHTYTHKNPQNHLRIPVYLVKIELLVNSTLERMIRKKVLQI